MKKVLINVFSFLRIVFVFYISFVGFRSLFYENTHVYIDRVTVAMTFMLICGILYFLCENDRNMKHTPAGQFISAGLLPCVMGMMLFSQYHFVIFVMILIAIAIIYALCFMSVFKHFSRKENLYKRITAAHKSVFSVVCAIAFCIMVIPSISGVIKEEEKIEYTLESLTNEFESASYTDAETVFEKYPDVLSDIKNWDSLENDEKTALISRVAFMEIEHLGINTDEFTVISEKNEKHAYGYYTTGGKEIHINYVNVISKNAESALTTILHEVFHFYQWYMTEELDFESDIVKNSYYFKNARAWKENQDEYIMAAIDYDSYLKQPLEADAEAYAQVRVHEYLDAAENITEV